MGESEIAFIIEFANGAPEDARERREEANSTRPCCVRAA